ncbi:MAG: hypothetical protein ABEJ28_03350, partial [Salinigranum sp.]
MAAIQALQTALDALRRNPVLFLGGLILGAILLPQSALQLLQVPLAPFALQVVTFFVTPFVVAGLVGMADESLAGSTRLGTLTAVGRDRYVPLLLGNFVQLAIFVVFGVAFVIVAVVWAVTMGASAAGGLTPGAIGAGAVLGVLLVVGLLVLVLIVVMFFIQFFAVAIVVDEEGPIEGFSASFGLVRRNLLSTLGYSIINFVVAVVATAPVSGFVLYRTFSNINAAAPGQPPAAMLGFSAAEVAAISIISLALTMLLGTFQ